MIRARAPGTGPPVAPLIQRNMAPSPGIASPLGGLFLWQLDDQSRRLATPATWADAEPGSVFEASIGWALYHVLEHEAGHYGQINLLRHQYRARGGGAGAR